MCIIVLNKEGLIPRNTLNECCESNPDGMGLMYAKNGKIKVIKELKDFDSFYSKYMKIRLSHKGNIALHFRIRTAGKVDEKNIHPFFINQNLAFMHNGIIPYKSEVDSEISDTMVFNEHILKNLPGDFLNYSGFKALVKDYIDSDKLLFMDSGGHVTLINEDKGNWLKSNWFSNYSYCYSGQKYEYFDECELCGHATFTDREIYSGLCADCLGKYDQKCPECNVVLSDTEIEDGFCETCQTLYS